MAGDIRNSPVLERPIVKLGLILLAVLLAVFIVQVIIPFFGDVADPAGAESKPRVISTSEIPAHP